MRIDDFVCLGRTVPEESRKYGQKVCMAGYSDELRTLMRVYPLPVSNPIRTRRTCILDLERNPLDSRVESWKLKQHGASILAVSDGEIPTPKVVSFLVKHEADSIEELNSRRLSLGVLEANDCRGLFAERSGAAHPDQGLLFDALDDCFGSNAIDIAPYLQFTDKAGHPHRLQVREWGCYEWLRNHREAAHQLWANMRLGNGHPTLLLVGNMANRRTSWLVIKTFKVMHQEQLDIFGLAATTMTVESIP